MSASFCSTPNHYVESSLPAIGGQTAPTHVHGVIDQETRASGESGFAWPRYSRILVDSRSDSGGRVRAPPAVPYAVDHRSQLILLTVVPNPRFVRPVPGFSPRSLVGVMKQEAAAQLRDVSASLPHGISVTTILRQGDPTAEILRVARDQQVDVSCIGARGRGRLASMLLGSVSSAVVHRGPVPVLVLNPPAEPAETP
jgi:nucleotide-binding universal stress UspA family protein